MDYKVNGYYTGWSGIASVQIIESWYTQKADHGHYCMAAFILLLEIIANCWAYAKWCPNTLAIYFIRIVDHLSSFLPF